MFAASLAQLTATTSASIAIIIPKPTAAMKPPAMLLISVKRCRSFEIADKLVFIFSSQIIASSRRDPNSRLEQLVIFERVDEIIQETQR